MAVFGSNPEFGSSQNRYLGLFTIALAIETRFCIPPDISAGNLLLTPSRFTLFSTSFTREIIFGVLWSENMRKGNIIFSSIVIESKRAPP